MRTAGAALVAVGAGVLAWQAWLGWGMEGGRYAVWQVVGCALTAAAGTVLAVVLARGRHTVLLALLTSLALTVRWTVDAAAVDETGLFAVGALFLLGGASLGLLVVASITEAVLRRRRPAPG